jgi:hypothetical protein
LGYPVCSECGSPIDERLETRWGGERCHRACGEAVWRREWQARESSINFHDRGETALENAPGSWSEAEEERAAIVEFDGAIPRSWAEGFARLHPDRPPGDVPLKRWRQFVDDVGRFLDLWAGTAVALGWSPYELFGCDRERPFARIDQAGLLWFLSGDELVVLSEDTAIIERRGGARQTYRRKPIDPGRVLAWEIVQ